MYREHDEKITPETRQRIEVRRKIAGDRNSDEQTVRRANREVSKAIRKDIRNYRKQKILQTIGQNKSMKVLRKKLTNGEKEIIKLRNKEGQPTSNREKIVLIVEEFYETLHKNQLTLDPTEPTTPKVTNQGSEDIPDILKDKIYQP